MEAKYFRRWIAYQKAFSLANAIYQITKSFPAEEQFGLTNQVRRSSRSVCSNLAEAFGKRRYEKHFIAKITDAYSENAETQAWLDFAQSQGHLPGDRYEELILLAEEVAKLLHYMEFNAKKFTHNTSR
ncbi:four helix bundle protein [Lewinella sp. W8]|uniref:four helix bundle protein n=1 Tax=Lewinella sp. W8 TaxID=2528208 RepID=UPI0010675635|nr:four helix bundle protein [Lewinella sp. W8]